MSFGAFLDGEQSLGRTRSVVDDVELMFVADANAARIRIAAGCGLDQRDDGRLFGDLEFLQKHDVIINAYTFVLYTIKLLLCV